MKEDVLEQIVEDYLQSGGYFTTHNIPFRPSAELERSKYSTRLHSVASDIDVVGIAPRKRGLERVQVVTCKSFQKGFNADYWLKQAKTNGKVNGRLARKSFRELWDPIWNRAFRREVEKLSDRKNFLYTIAVTRFSGTTTDPETLRTSWLGDARVAKSLDGCDLRFIDLREIWNSLGEASSDQRQRPASSEIGRLAQLLRAASLVDR